MDVMGVGLCGCKRKVVIPMYDKLIKRLRECTAEMNGEKTLWNQAADAIEDLQKRKHGKWIVMNDEYIDDCKCSECGCIEYFNKGWKRFNFCPSCGAEMT